MQSIYTCSVHNTRIHTQSHIHTHTQTYIHTHTHLHKLHENRSTLQRMRKHICEYVDAHN